VFAPVLRGDAVDVHHVEHSVTLEPIWEALIGGRMSITAISDGTMPVPSEPGLGLQIDEAALPAHRIGRSRPTGR
jgi:hypothetical protein